MKNFFCLVSSKSPAFDDDLWMDLLINELLSFSEEFTGKYAYSGGTITDFFVLNFRDVWIKLNYQ